MLPYYGNAAKTISPMVSQWTLTFSLHKDGNETCCLFCIISLILICNLLEPSASSFVSDQNSRMISPKGLPVDKVNYQKSILSLALGK